MKKRIEKKLRLTKETLRNLSERDLNDMVGAATMANTCVVCVTEHVDTCTESCYSIRTAC